MMKKKFIRLVSLGAAALLMASTAHAEDSTSVLKDLLQKKIAEIETLLLDPLIISTVEQAVIARKDLTEKEILDKDSHWRDSKPGDVFDKEVIQPFMTNDCAHRLKEFQKQNGDFVEIFITGIRGLNVCQTNKTSDFYQADEAWWTQAFAGGKGKSCAGKIEYDDSAHSESIPVYVPIRNTRGQTIGVCKAVVDLAALEDEL